MGFVATRAGWRWIFWTFTVVSTYLSVLELIRCLPCPQTNGIQFLCYLFFSPETKYVRSTATTRDEPAPKKQNTFRSRYLSFGKIPGTAPLKLQDFYYPVVLLKRLSVSIPTLAHSVMFAFCSVLICVEIPGLLGVKFNLNFEAIGLNFISNIVG